MKDKVVLAYSGGLDTSCCVKWIQDHYDLDVICFSAFLGEVSNAVLLAKRAKAAGSVKVFIQDLKQEFAKDYILPALWAHARYEGKYLMATSLGRPLIAKHLVQIAQKEGAKYVAHGCTGKGNDQVRLEVGVRSLDPSLKIIAPLKEWEFTSREEEIEYAMERKIPISVTKRSPYSIDKNIWGIAIEAGVLEDLTVAPPEDAFVLTRALNRVPSKPMRVEIEFVKGVPVKLNGRRLNLVALIEKLNGLAGQYGIGRVDMIENRLVGIKSREVYEAPAGVVLMQAHEELESLVFDREFLHYKRVLSEKYADLIYYGLYFTPLREALDAFFARHQDRVTGKIVFSFNRGHAIVQSRESGFSIYNEALATYSAKDAFDRTCANGFVKLWGLPYEGSTKLKGPKGKKK